MSTTTVECGHCQGTGRVPFTGVYAKTLRLLRAQKAALSGAELARKASCGHTAMCNRLVRLEEMGLASGIPSGREKMWVAMYEE